MAETIVVKFEKERETKGTVVFAEVHDETEAPVVRTLYIAKHSYAKLGNPTSVQVTIAPAE